MTVRRSTRPAALAAAVAAALTAVLAAALTGCGAADDAPATGGGASEGSTFPLTVTHALGTTEVSEEPVDVVTWGFGSTDAALALGVVPVAMPAQPYGGDAEGVLPWIADELEQLGAPTPTLLPNEGEQVPFEAIAAAGPDLVLANYSGLTQADYDTLSEIAPVLAYPDQPWTTPWRDVVTGVGEVLGRSEEAAQLVADTDAQVAAAAAEHPELAGRSVAMVWDTAGTFYVYEAADPRVEFLTDLGLVVDPSVDENATDESTFYSTLSYEQVGLIKSDVLVTYGETQEEVDTFLAQPYAQSMEQVRDGRVAPLVGQELIAAVSPPTVLSLPYALDDYLTALSAAA